MSRTVQSFSDLRLDPSDLEDRRIVFAAVKKHTAVQYIHVVLQQSSKSQTTSDPNKLIENDHGRIFGSMRRDSW